MAEKVEKKKKGAEKVALSSNRKHLLDCLVYSSTAVSEIASQIVNEEEVSEGGWAYFKRTLKNLEEDCAELSSQEWKEN